MSADVTPSAEDARDLLRQRLYVALVEQRVIDSQKYGEAPYAPITWEDVDRVVPPGACPLCDTFHVGECPTSPGGGA